MEKKKKNTSAKIINPNDVRCYVVETKLDQPPVHE